MQSQWQLPAGEYNLDLGFNINWFNLGFDSAALGNKAAYLQSQFDSVVPTEQSNFSLQLRPKVSLTLGNALFDFGFNLYTNNYKSDLLGNEFKPYFFPEVLVQYPFVEDVLSVFAGVKGRLRQNSYRNLTDDNPYVQPAFVSKPTRTTDIFLGVEGIFSATTTFNLKGGYLIWKDRPLYYRDPAYRSNYFLDSLRNIPSLGTVYDNVESFYARGELSFNINNNLQAVAFAELRSYNTKNEAEAWHMPNFFASINLDYTFREKLKLGTDWNYVGPREAFLQEDNPQLSSTLPAYLDVALNFEYLYNSRLSGFLTVSNLLNQKYDLYLGYKAQRINFLMGFAYKF
ncbi:MAG: hypothetical protein U5L96_08375 [Owenweeksia sp.]|nr:hypothetical protein [Owenweeksia sp.]